MADWNTPTLPTAYATFLTNVKDRDVDAITMQVAAASNPPTGAFRYVRASDKFQEWSGAAYVDKIISLAGGGTGAATAAGARTSLGLGDMATQSSAAVAITGGNLAGVGTGLTALNASNLSSGTVATARLGSGAASSSTFLRGDQSWAGLTIYLAPAVTQVADFTAAVESYYPLSGSHTVTLPTVTGNHGKRIFLVNVGTGGWTIDGNAAETINGALTFDFSFGQYSSLTLIADANIGGWSIF
jgi:hypothetical protein